MNPMKPNMHCGTEELLMIQTRRYLVVINCRRTGCELLNVGAGNTGGARGCDGRLKDEYFTFAMKDIFLC